MGSNTYAATDITPLSSLEAIRKRPSMYYDLADPLLGSKLMLQALMFPLELGIKAQVILTSEISGTVAWGKALSPAPALPRPGGGSGNVEGRGGGGLLPGRGPALQEDT